MMPRGCVVSDPHDSLGATEREKAMGHMNVTENLAPVGERVGCDKHETYNNDCFTCFVINGGGTD